MGSQLAMEHAQLMEFLNRWREPPVMPLLGDGEKQLSEIIVSLEHIASRDSIRAGRAWIEANVAAAHAIAGNLMKRIGLLGTFAHRLHVLFLLHDVLQTEAAKPDAGRQLIIAFKPYLVWMLRPVYQLALMQDEGQPGEECNKVLRLLSLWQERSILSPKEAVEIRTIATAQNLPTVAPQHVAPPQQGLGLALPPGVVPMPGMMPQVRPGMAAPQQSLLGALQQQAYPGYGGLIRPQVPGAIVGMPGQQVTLPIPGQLGALTPESVPVGVMASMLKQVSKRSKDMHTAFVPYKPLDPLYTPQTFPPPGGPVTERMMARLKEYYDAIGADRFAEISKDESQAALPAGEALALPDRQRSRSPHGRSPAVA